MTLEEELLNHLDAVIQDGQTKARNIDIIAYYHGFGDSAWPTYEETGERFGIGTRERVRQIIASNFRDRTEIHHLPELRRCAQFVVSHPVWLGSQLVGALRENGWVLPGANLRGILNLMQDLGLCADYDLYDGRMVRLTRAEMDEMEDCFVLSKKSVPALKKAIAAARSLPGLLGLADLSYLHTGEVPRESVLAALHMDPDAWVGNHEGRLWYCYEDRDNCLINASEKVFSIAPEVEVSRLAESLANYLRRRSNQHPYPDAPAIEKYIRGSRFFECDALLARFEGEKTDLPGIDKEIVTFLEHRGDTSFVSIRDHLIEKGYGLPLIQKAVGNSPLVHVDKSAGRLHYIYSLVTRRNEERAKTAKKDVRYELFAERLRRIGALGSDMSVQTKARREQAILSQWLFDGKETCHCAICGESYGVAAMVTAHKKKRSLAMSRND